MVHLRCKQYLLLAAIHSCDAHLILKSSMGKDEVKRRRPLKYTYLSYQDIVHRLEYSVEHIHIYVGFTAQDLSITFQVLASVPGEGDESKPCKQFIVGGNSHN